MTASCHVARGSGTRQPSRLDVRVTCDGLIPGLSCSGSHRVSISQLLTSGSFPHTFESSPPPACPHCQPLAHRGLGGSVSGVTHPTFGQMASVPLGLLSSCLFPNFLFSTPLTHSYMFPEIPCAEHPQSPTFPLCPTPLQTPRCLPPPVGAHHLGTVPWALRGSRVLQAQDRNGLRRQQPELAEIFQDSCRLGLLSRDSPSALGRGCVPACGAAHPDQAAGDPVCELAAVETFTPKLRRSSS